MSSLVVTYGMTALIVCAEEVRDRDILAVTSDGMVRRAASGDTIIGHVIDGGAAKAGEKAKVHVYRTPLAPGSDSSRCSRCNRKLTNPESRALGIGPICVHKLQHEQDTVPQVKPRARRVDAKPERPNDQRLPSEWIGIAL